MKEELLNQGKKFIDNQVAIVKKQFLILDILEKDFKESLIKLEKVINLFLTYS